MSLLGMVNKFKHKGEIRESKDEIFIGEMIYLLSLQGWPCTGFTRKMLGLEVAATTSDLQHVRFRTLNDPVLYSLAVRLDRKSGTGALSAALMGSKATLYVTAEVKNLLADPDDLINQWATDVKNIFKFPLMGQVKLNHELNSILAEKGAVIDIDQYVLQGEAGRNALNTLLLATVDELREALKGYKKA
jgi:hypothetical protein